MSSKVYIILVNYNGWKDTIECLESVFKSDYDNYQVIVVDNASPNNSIDYLQAWAKGEQEVLYTDTSKLKHLSMPHEKKPLNFILYDKDTALAGGDPALELKSNNPLVLIQSGKNGGFAAGNNIGIKYALAKGDMDYVWLLNNDTAIQKDTLSCLVRTYEYLTDDGIKVGACGSKLQDYSDPSHVQSIGRSMGFLYKLTPINMIDVKSDNDFIKVDDLCGASMLLGSQFVDEVGLIPEEYFLYMEETDWLFSGAKNAFNYYTSMRSIVYHKESHTTGGKFSILNVYYNTRNRIHFFRKYAGLSFFALFPLFCMFKLKDALKYLAMGRVDLVKALMKGMSDGVLKVYEKRDL